MANDVSWFEIPVTDMDRAITFYNTILGVDMQKGDIGGLPYTVFPNGMQGVSGGLVQGDGFVPRDTGTMVYLSAGDDLSVVLGRVDAAGGRVLHPKTHIGEGMGYMAHFLDTEGNRVGLFSIN